MNDSCFGHTTLNWNPQKTLSMDGQRKITLLNGEECVVSLPWTMAMCSACLSAGIMRPAMCIIVREDSCVYTDCLQDQDPNRTCKRMPPPPTLFDMPLVPWPSAHWGKIREFKALENSTDTSKDVVHACKYCNKFRNCEELVFSCGSQYMLANCADPSQIYVKSRPCAGSSVICAGLASSTEWFPIKNTESFCLRPKYFQFLPISLDLQQQWTEDEQLERRHILRQWARVFAVLYPMPTKDKSQTFFPTLTKVSTNPTVVLHAFFKTYVGLQRLIGNYLLLSLRK